MIDDVRNAKPRMLQYSSDGKIVGCHSLEQLPALLVSKLALISSPALRFRVASGPLFEYLLMHKIPTDALKN